MASSNTNLRVDLKMKCFIQLARKCIVDNLEEEIEKTDNEEMKEALIEKLTDVLENDLIISKRKNNIVILSSFQQKKSPVEPVNVRGTPLKLKNMSSNTVYRKFCTNIANMLGYQSDFSDAPFYNYTKNNRVYEAIKVLYSSGKIDQESLDQLVTDAESEE